MAESPVESQPIPQQSPPQPLRSSTLSSFANLQTVAQAKAELETRLAGIHNDLQLTQTIGLLFVRREEDLKNAFEQLRQLDKQEELLQGEPNDTESGAAVQTLPESGAAVQTLPESFREQLSALDKGFQEGENGIAGLKRLIDAQLVC